MIKSLKPLTQDEFVHVTLKGRFEKGMPSFASNPAVVTDVKALCAYLNGRSDGAITQAKVVEAT